MSIIGVLFAIAYMLLLLPSRSMADESKYDCCSAEYSYDGVGCTSKGTDYLGTTTYCVPRDPKCTTCLVSSAVNASDCTKCCSPTSTICKDKLSTDITYSGWALVCIIFAGSCCCCCILFISSETSRNSEGYTFQQAYLLPIPIVTADLDFDEKSFPLPPDQPTAIAKAHNNIDIPIAQPAEYNPLMSYFPEREYVWD